MSALKPAISLLTKAAKKIDWGVVTGVLGALIGKLIDKSGTSDRTKEERIEEVEKISKQLASHLSAVSETLRIISARVIIVGIIALVSLLLSLAVMILQFVK